jgi:hypothetical protein
VLRVTDEGGKQQEQAYAIEVFPAVGQNTPEFRSTPVTEAVAGGNYEYNVRVNAIGGYAVTLTAAVDSGFAFVDNGGGLGVVSANPVPAAGSYNVEITATNSIGDVATQSFSIEVAAANQAPMASDPADTTIDALSSITVMLSATDPDGDALTFNSLSVPSWASLQAVSSTSAMFKGFPAREDEGTFNIAVLVSDGQLVDTASFTITVNPAPAAEIDQGEDLGDDAEDASAGEVDVESSISSRNDVDDISVYPNPSSTFVRIASPVEGTVYMYDISGALVNVFPVKKDVNEVNLSEYNNGLYLLKIVSAEGAETIRLRIQK